MYTPIEISIIFGAQGNKYGFNLDAESMKDLVSANIISINRTLNHFARSKDKRIEGKIVSLKMSKRKMVQEIGIHVEMIEKFIFEN